MEFPTLDRIEGLVASFSARQREMTDRITEVDEQGVEAAGDSGLVTATVASDGGVLGVMIDPRAMRLPSQDLADEVVRALQRAQRAAAGRLREVVRDVFGEDPT